MNPNDNQPESPQPFSPPEPAGPIPQPPMAPPQPPVGPGVSPTPQPAQFQPPTPQVTPQPMAPPQPPSAFGAGMMQGPPVPSNHPDMITPGPAPAKKSRKRLFAIALIVLLVALAGGYVFAFYLPNRPAAVWNTGLDRTGQALTAFVDKVTDEKQQQKIDKYRLSGDFSLKTDSGATFSGTLLSAGDASDTSSSVGITASNGQENFNLKLNLLTKLLPANQYPDVYLRVDGLKTAVAQNPFLSGFSSFDKKWLYLSGDYLQKLTDQAGFSQKQASPTKRLTRQDITEFVKAMNTVAGDYIFTSDPSKSILERKSYVGKETIEGTKTYHYKVGFNQSNSEAFCDALASSIAKTSAYQKLSGTHEQNKSLKQFVTECKKEDPKSKQDTFDLWIDAKYKLLFMIRVPAQDSKNGYSDLGLKYKGGNSATAFIAGHDDQFDVRADLTFNLDTFTASGTANMVSKEPGNGYTMNAKLEFGKYDGDTTVKPPKKNIINLEKLFNELQKGTLPSKLQ